MSAPLSNTTLWDALYSWVKSVLPEVEVIESHENAPSPAGNFLCIDYAGNWTLRGSSASRMVSDREDLSSARVYTYTGSIQIRDVDGNGENLMLLLESLEDPSVLGTFAEKGFSVLRSSGPQAIPALQQSEWRRESILTLELAWARAYAGSILTIESVEIVHVENFGTIDSNEELVVDDRRNVLQSEQIKYKLKIETQEANNGT